MGLITTIIEECLTSVDDRVKAVACYDLGEFSRFFPRGKQFCEERSVRIKMVELMQDPKVSAEVKKEAITCY